MSRPARIALASLAVTALLAAGLWFLANRADAPSWLRLPGFLSSGPPSRPGNRDKDDPALQATLPVANPSANLSPSPLNDLLKPGLTPQEQTGIVGQMLLDYWTNLRSLPAGTWEETCAALAGANRKGLAFVSKDHPALNKEGFRPSPESPGIHLHVISSTEGVFQLIYEGPDGKPFTDDDLIRNFPPDLESR